MVGVLVGVIEGVSDIVGVIVGVRDIVGVMEGVSDIVGVIEGVIVGVIVGVGVGVRGTGKFKAASGAALSSIKLAVYEEESDSTSNTSKLLYPLLSA